MPSSIEPHGGWHVFWHCAASCVGVRWLALWRVGRRTSTFVRAGCVGHTARWPVVVLRLAGQER